MCWEPLASHLVCPRLSRSRPALVDCSPDPASLLVSPCQDWRLVGRGRTAGLASDLSEVTEMRGGQGCLSCSASDWSTPGQNSLHGMEHGSHLSLCHKEPAEARNAPSTGLWVTSAGSGIRGLVWQHHDLTQSVHNLPMRVLHSALPQ